MANAFRNRLGSLIANTGARLKAKDYGVSEFFSGNELDKAYDSPVAQVSAPAMPVQGPMPSPVTTTTQANFDPFEEDYALEEEMALSAGAGGGGGSAAAAEVYVPEFRTVQGDPTRYDINDPAQAKAYFDKRLALAESFRTKNLADLDALYGSRLKSAELDYAGQAATLDDRFRDVDTREASYAKDYDGRVSAFGKGYSTSQAKRLNAFAGASGFQSAQGDSERLAYGQYEEGLGNLSDEKTTNQNAFKADRDRITRQKSLADEKYNIFTGDLSREIGSKRSALDQSVNDFKGEASAELAPFDYASGISDYKDRYQLEAYDPTATQNADLSKLGAATSFNAAAPQAGAATGGNAFVPTANKRSPMESYLDVNKEKKQKDPMKQYLYA